VGNDYPRGSFGDSGCDIAYNLIAAGRIDEVGVDLAKEPRDELARELLVEAVAVRDTVGRVADQGGGDALPAGRLFSEH
jgi:hypothetical protein